MAAPIAPRRFSPDGRRRPQAASSLEDATRFSQLESELEGLRETSERDEEDLEQAIIAQQCLEARNAQLEIELQDVEGELCNIRSGDLRRGGSSSSFGSCGSWCGSPSSPLSLQRAEAEKLQRRNDLLLEALNAAAQSSQHRHERGRAAKAAVRGESCSSELRRVLPVIQDLRGELGNLQELDALDVEEQERQVVTLRAQAQEAEDRGIEQRRFARRELSELLANNEAMETELQVLRRIATDEEAAGQEDAASLRSQIEGLRCMADANANASANADVDVYSMDSWEHVPLDAQRMRSADAPVGIVNSSPRRSATMSPPRPAAELSCSPEPSPRNVEACSLLDELSTTVSSASPRGLLTLDNEVEYRAFESCASGCPKGSMESVPSIARRLSQKALNRRDKHQRARKSIAGFESAAPSASDAFVSTQGGSLEHRHPQDDGWSQLGSSTLSVIGEDFAAHPGLPPAYAAPCPTVDSTRLGGHHLLHGTDLEGLRRTTGKGAATPPGTISSIATSRGLSEGGTDSGNSCCSHRSGDVVGKAAHLEGGQAVPASPAARERFPWEAADECESSSSSLPVAHFYIGDAENGIPPPSCSDPSHVDPSPREVAATAEVEQKLRRWLAGIPRGSDVRPWDDSQVLRLASFATRRHLEGIPAEEIYRRYVDHQVEVASAVVAGAGGTS